MRRAIFLKLQTLRIVSLVLDCRIVASTAFCACQRNDYAHDDYHLPLSYGMTEGIWVTIEETLNGSNMREFGEFLLVHFL